MNVGDEVLIRCADGEERVGVIHCFGEFGSIGAATREGAEYQRGRHPDLDPVYQACRRYDRDDIRPMPDFFIRHGPRIIPRSPVCP